MWIIGQIQYSYAVQLYKGMTQKQPHSHSTNDHVCDIAITKTILPVCPKTRNSLYEYLITKIEVI